jgi:hypothetical protein
MIKRGKTINIERDREGLGGRLTKSRGQEEKEVIG